MGTLKKTGRKSQSVGLGKGEPVRFSPEQIEALDKKFTTAYERINREARIQQTEAVEASTKIYMNL